MTKVTAGIFSTNSSPKAARFAGNWLAGAAESRSARRRLNAILRLACRTLGLKRGKGLGMLGVAAAVVVGLASPVMAQTTAGPVIASSPQIGLEAKPVPAGSFRLPDGFAFVDATNRSSLLEFTVHAGAIIRSSGQVQHAPFQFVPTNVILEKDYTFLSGEGVFPAGTTFDGPVTMAAGTETGYKTWFPKGTVFPLGTVRDSGKNPIPGITPGVPTSEAVVVNGLIFPKKDKLQPGLDTRFSQIKINTDANSKPAQTSTDVPGDIAIGSGAIAKGKIGADVPNHPEAKYHSATAIGKNASAEGDDAVAIGSLAWVKGDEGLALGGNAVVDKDNSVALGAGANAFHKNSVALGHVSVTEDVHSVGNDVTLNGKSYTIGSHGMGVVSIGSKRFGPSRTRQIINVAPGVVAPGSTDATNGEQLHVAYDSINELGKTVKDQGDRLTAAEGTIATQGSKIGALDKTVTDQGDRLTTAEGALKTQSDTLITHGKQIGDLKQELNAGKTGLVQNDPTGKEISIGGDSTAKTVDFSGKTPQLDANGNPVKDANGNTVMIDADRTLTGVAPGVKPNDVVNKGQLDGVEKQAAAAQEAADKVKLTADASAKQIGNLETSVKDQGDALNVHNKQIGALQKNALLHDGTAYNANHNGTKSRIINVENGVDVSDAATVGQLDDLKQSLSAGKTGLVQNDPTGKEISIGGDSTAKTVDFGGKTPQLDANGKPVLDANGKPVLVDADRTLTGVAPGVNANDAVNKGQLDAVVEASKAIGGSIAGALGGGATIDKDGKVTLPTLSLTSLGNDASGKPVTQPGTIVDGLNAVDAVVKGQGDRLATAEGALTAQGNKLTAAENTLKTQGDALAIHDKQIVALAKNTLLHDGTAYNANHNGAKNRIINVENGVDVSDAATVGQLDDLKQSLSAGKTGLVQNDPTGKEISIGGDSTAKTVDFGGKTPQLDANGNPVKDANGNTVMIDADRTLTGVAPGVNANDAVNKTQLDGVEKQAAAAQEAADKVKLTADASAKKIDALDTTVKDQGGRLTATEGALTTQGKQIGDLETSVKDQGGRLTTAENTLKTQGDALTTQGKQIGDLETSVKDQGGRLTTAENTLKTQGDALTTQGKQIGDLETSVKDQGGRLTTAENTLKTQGDALTTQGKQIGELETSVKDQGGRLTTAEGALKTQGDKIGALEKNALLHDGTAYNANHNGTKNRIINVENGVDVSDAATVGQLDDLKQSLNAGKTGLVQNDPAGDEIKIGGDSTANTVNIGGKTPELDDNDDPVKDANGNTVMIDADRTLTGVADGVEPNDAVNKSQLDAVEEKADNAQLAADNAQITADASAEQLEGIGAHETVAGRIAEASETVGKSVAGVLGGGATADKDGKVTMPSLKLTSLGNDANGRPVTQPSTIVDGLNAVDAVVKGQGDRLTTTEGTVLKQDGILATATKDIADQGGKIAELNKNDEAFNTRFQGVDQTVGDLKKQLEAEAKLAAENDDMLDTVVNHVDSLDSKLGNLENKAVAYDTTPDGKKTNQLTLQGGDLNAPVLIKNVAEGKDDTDAANVAQVKKATVEANTYTDKAATTTLTKSKTYTDEVATTTLTKSYEYTDTALTKVGNLSETVNGIDGRTGALETRTGALEKGFDQLSSDIKSVRKEAHQAAAVGLAASSLRFDNTPGKVSVAMGGAVWRDQGAMAFGAGYTSESGKIRTNLTGATSGGEFGVSAGISFTLN